MSESKCPRCDGPIDDCFCPKCSQCGSRNTRAWDDGDDYPPNIECKDCGHWD